MTTYRNCKIFRPKLYNAAGLFAWEDLTFGIESEDGFATIEQARADIDMYFGDGPAIVMGADGELSQAA